MAALYRMLSLTAQRHYYQKQVGQTMDEWQVLTIKNPKKIFGACFAKYDLKE
jgi:hypothetical protein